MTDHNPRSQVLDLMHTLEARGVHCRGCPGTCCTFRANSMQITPAEARDILRHLQSSGQNLSHWRQRWQQCVQEFRLDNVVGQGRKALRRTYTCPFYSGGPQGCTLPFDVKPYGCLAFNPMSQARDADNCGIDCRAQMEVHPPEEQSEARYPDSQQIKLPIPLALLELSPEMTQNLASGSAIP